MCRATWVILVGLWRLLDRLRCLGLLVLLFFGDCGLISWSGTTEVDWL